MNTSRAFVKKSRRVKETVLTLWDMKRAPGGGVALEYKFICVYSQHLCFIILAPAKRGTAN